MECSKYFGIHTEMVTPADMKSLHPSMNTDDLLGGIISPHDGTLDPAGWCEGLVRAAKMNRAKVTLYLLAYHSILC